MLELAAQIPNLEVEERAITLHEVAITIIAIIIVVIVTITIARFLRRMPKGSYWKCLGQALLPPYHKLAISGFNCTVILTISVVITLIVIIIIVLTRFGGKDHPVATPSSGLAGNLLSSLSNITRWIKSIN